MSASQSRDRSLRQRAALRDHRLSRERAGPSSRRLTRAAASPGHDVFVTSHSPEAPPCTRRCRRSPASRLCPDGAIEGYASLFGEVDQARDMVMPGAFTQTLKQRGLRKIPMLFQHDPSEPVGVWLELAEDWRGLTRAGPADPGRDARARIAVAAQSRRGRRPVDRLPHRARPDRSEEPGAAAVPGRPVGNLHRHVSAAQRRAGQRGEAARRNCRGCARRRKRNGARCWRAKTSARRAPRVPLASRLGERDGRKTALRGVARADPCPGRTSASFFTANAGEP